MLSLFETVALGVAYNIANGTLCSEAEISKRAKSLWSTKGFTDWASSGTTASRRLPRLIPLGRTVFSHK